MMVERIHWESATTNGASAEVARSIAVQIVHEMVRMQANVESVQRMRRFACTTLGLHDRSTDTDTRLALIERLVNEVTYDMRAWLDAQVVALHDAHQTLEIRGSAERERGD